jgi:hypothetical protein
MPPSGMLSRVAPVRIDIPQKLLFLQKPHGVTSQKMTFFIVIAVKTSNLTFLGFIHRPEFFITSE